MDSLFLNSPYLEEIFLFENEENAASDDVSDEEAPDLDGLSSSEESDDEEDIPSAPIFIKNTRLKKAKFKGDLAAKVRNILGYMSLHHITWIRFTVVPGCRELGLSAMPFGSQDSACKNLTPYQ